MKETMAEIRKSEINNFAYLYKEKIEKEFGKHTVLWFERSEREYLFWGSAISISILDAKNVYHEFMLFEFPTDHFKDDPLYKLDYELGYKFQCKNLLPFNSNFSKRKKEMLNEQ